MAFGDHPNHSKIITSSLIALVSLSALVMIYSDYSVNMAGASTENADTWQLTIEYGDKCGTCAVALNKNQPLPDYCYKTLQGVGQLFRSTDDDAVTKCCARVCMFVGFDKCGAVCTNTASNKFNRGKSRYGANPFTTQSVHEQTYSYRYGDISNAQIQRETRIAKTKSSRDKTVSPPAEQPVNYPTRYGYTSQAQITSPKMTTTATRPNSAVIPEPAFSERMYGPISNAPVNQP